MVFTDRVAPEQELLEELDVFVARGLLTPEECRFLIEETEAEGFEPAPLLAEEGMIIDKRIRHSDQVLLEREDWAEGLWERIAMLDLPWFEGREPAGVNEYFRFSRYDPGHFFAPHYDSFFKRPGQRSFYTLLVYLNEGFVGGETVFEMLDIEVVPEAGMGLFFYHDTLHEGRPVAAGRKYLFRTDLMFAD